MKLWFIVILDTITVSTNKILYFFGNEVLISGKVREIEIGSQITVIISNEKDITGIEQLTLKKNLIIDFFWRYIYCESFVWDLGRNFSPN